MDHKFTEQIKLWLEKLDDKRNYAVYAFYILKQSGNQIMYKPRLTAVTTSWKYYNFRVQSLLLKIKKIRCVSHALGLAYILQRRRKFVYL